MINNVTLKHPDGDLIEFDRRTKTKDGWVNGVDTLPVSWEKACVNSQRTSVVNEYYKEVGHQREKTTSDTAELFEIKLEVEGSFKPCEDCVQQRLNRGLRRKFWLRKLRLKENTYIWVWVHPRRHVLVELYTGCLYHEGIGHQFCTGPT